MLEIELVLWCDGKGDIGFSYLTDSDVITDRIVVCSMHNTNLMTLIFIASIVSC